MLETLDGFNLRNAHLRLLCHLTFFWLEARPQIFHEAMRDVPLARGGKEISMGRTLFVGCPFEARPVSSETVTFAFLVCSDPTGFSPAGSASAFRLPELTARFGGIVYRVKQDRNEGRSGSRVEREQLMTKL